MASPLDRGVLLRPELPVQRSWRRCVRRASAPLGASSGERFSGEHVEPTRSAYDLVYSLTLAEQRRYTTMGVDAPYVQWGVHPEYDAYTPERRDDVGDFHYHAGLLGKRKPFKEVVNAFSATPEAELRLIVKAQIERRMKFLERATKRDSRVELVLEDLPTDEHLQMFANSHVCMAPARWEGLGLHLSRRSRSACRSSATTNPR